MNLDTLKVFTSYVAPVLAFVLAMLSTFTEKKKDKEIQNGSQITKIKVLTAYGKTIIILLFIATLVTLSGIIVNKKIEIQDGNKKAKQYSRDSTKAADIYKTAVQTLGTVNSSLSDTKDIQNKAQNMSTELTGQTLQLKKMTTPILPMKIKYTVERTVKIKEGIKYDKSGVSYQNIVDALAKDLGPDSMNGHLLYYGRKNPNHKSVYNISYNNATKDSSNLMKLSMLVYRKLSSFVELSFFRKSDNTKRNDKIPLYVYAQETPKNNLDNIFTYKVTLIPPDSIKLTLTVETDPYDFSNKYDIKSWMDLNDGLLKIDCTSGQLIKVKLGTGPYYTYPMTFSINKSDTIGENSFLKSINVH